MKSKLSYLIPIGFVLIAATFKTTAWEPDLPAILYNYANIALPQHFNNQAIQNLDNTPADNPITDSGATLGRVLFYDKELSLNRTIACASCHLQEFGFTDSAQFSLGFESGLTGRNSMGLSNARFYPNGQFFWDERALTLEHQVLMPIQDEVEMGMSLDSLELRLQSIEYYPQLFQDAFASPLVTRERISDALAQFVRSMVSYQSPYDAGRAMVAPGPAPDSFPNFSALENLGMQIFRDPARGACITCHATDMFVQVDARNNGLELVSVDSGLYAVTAQLNDVGKFKAPSLRNIGLGAPYMHDGRFQTLEEVVEHYNNGVQAHPNLAPQLRQGGPGGPPNAAPRVLNLTEMEKDALVAFMHTLTDTIFTTDPRWSDPFVFVNNTGLAERLVPIEANVYPNPTESKLLIETQLTGFNPLNVQILDINGRILQQYESMPAQTEIGLGELPHGTYLLRLVSLEGQSIQKIWKQ
ncbi:MAG: cytochrome c peroxidase [Bacteroidota bacterium]